MLVKDRLWIKHLRISCISFILELLLLGFLSIFFFVILVEWTRLIEFFNAYWIVHSYIWNAYWVSCCMIKLIKIFLYFKTHLKSFLVLKKKKKKLDLVHGSICCFHLQQLILCYNIPNFSLNYWSVSPTVPLVFGVH